MIKVDAHCDTLTKLMEINENINSNSCHVDLERLLSQGHYVQFFAAFIEPKYGQAYSLRRTLQILDYFFSQLHSYKDHMMLCMNYKDILKAVNQNKTAAFLTIEGGQALQGDISVLRTLYVLGVRSLCLTWNNRNEIADGAGESSTGGGLTVFGREVISEMNSLGMIVDVSHISERGFWDTIELTNAPVIASHSNVRKLRDHVRNLKDEQILAIKNNNGVIGINFYPPFLSGNKNSSVNDIVRHIEYIASLAGCGYIGIGSDFDGIDKTPDDIRGVEDLDKVFNELAKLNYSDKDISKIAGGNFLRIIKKVCK